MKSISLQVFFPIPFVFYNKDIVSRYNTLPEHIVLHRDTGHWDKTIYDQACFNNKDYKENRFHSYTFLKEDQSPPKALMEIFADSSLHVFRAVDVDLRKQYHPRFAIPNYQRRNTVRVYQWKGKDLPQALTLRGCYSTWKKKKKIARNHGPNVVSINFNIDSF